MQIGYIAQEDENGYMMQEKIECRRIHARHLNIAQEDGNMKVKIELRTVPLVQNRNEEEQYAPKTECEIEIYHENPNITREEA